MTFRQLIHYANKVTDIDAQLQLATIAMEHAKFTSYWLHMALYWGACVYRYNEPYIFAFQRMVFAYKIFYKFYNRDKGGDK